MGDKYGANLPGDAPTQRGSGRVARYGLLVLGVFLALFGQLLLTTNRAVPIGFGICGALLVVAGAIVLFRPR